MEKTDIRQFPSLSSSEDNQGVQYLLIDDQIHYKDRQVYVHVARKITSSAGLQNETRLSFRFNPSYEKLILHYVRILRSGKEINRLDPKHITVFQQESGLEYDLYDGRLTAMLVLNDLRVGDIIDYAFSLRGANPIYEDHCLEAFGLQWTSPVYKTKFRLLVPRDHPVYAKVHNSSLTPSIEHHGELKVYRLEQTSVAALHPDKDLPTWYDPFPWIQVTDFKNWSEVAAWANALYAVSPRLSARLKATIDDFRSKHSEHDELIIGVLRFVQDEIRYFGVELGENSHRPYAPDKVFGQRFGDCKDKSLLLCVILRQLGIEANPVLVNTRYRHAIGDWLPTPLAFDHVVVQVKANNKTYMLDPTISQQGGSLDRTSFPPYERGLVVDDDTDSLMTIADAHIVITRSEVIEEFTIPDFSGNILLKATSIYHGENADLMRSYFANNTRANIEQNYRDYYAKQYTKVESAGGIELLDDRAENRLTTIENYHISGFWEPMPDSLRINGNFYAQTIRDRIYKPVESSRTMSLGVQHPVWLKYTAQIALPEKWDAENAATQIADNAFYFTYNSEWQESNLTLRYEYKTRTDNVNPEETSAYIQNVDQALSVVGYSIYKYRGAGSRYPAWFFGMVAVLLLGGGYAIRTAAKYSQVTVVLPSGDAGTDITTPAVSPDYQHIRGWLILPAIGLIITSATLAWTLWVTFVPVFARATWTVVTTPGSESYHPLWAPLLIFEFVSTVAILVFGIIVALFFFRRKKNTKKMIIVFWLASLAFQLADYAAVTIFLSDKVLTEPTTVSGLARTIAVCSVWIPYFLVSKRVKGTFVR